MTLSVLRCLRIFWWMAKNEPCHISKCQSQQKNKQIAHPSHIHQAAFHSLLKKDGQSRLSAANLCLLCLLPMWEWQLWSRWECAWKGICGIFSPVLHYDVDYRGLVLQCVVFELFPHTCHCHLCIIMWNKLCMYSTLTVCVCVCAWVYGLVSDAVVSLVQCWRAGV